MYVLCFSKEICQKAITKASMTKVVLLNDTTDPKSVSVSAVVPSSVYIVGVVPSALPRLNRPALASLMFDLCRSKASLETILCVFWVLAKLPMRE